MLGMARSVSPQAREALSLLGSQIAVARKERRMTVSELATRVGVARDTVNKIERGDPSVGIGLAFEAAAVVGLPLFHADADRRGVEAARLRDRLALLPSTVRPVRIDNDF